MVEIMVAMATNCNMEMWLEVHAHGLQFLVGGKFWPQK